MVRRALVASTLALLGLAGAAAAAVGAGPAATTSTAALATGSTTVATPTLAASTGTTTAAGTTTTPAAASAPTSSATTLVFTGHGWGHGMGMSQWGAYGYARNGWDYRSILAHYYVGTTIGVEPALQIRVLLLDDKRTVTLSSGSPWKAVDADGAHVALPGGQLSVGAALAVNGRPLVSPVTFAPGPTPLAVGGAAYRGKIELVSNGKRLQVVNVLPLESYLLGVVGSEMPSTWPAAALEAQAVAARSYALAELENVVTAQAFDVYGDTRSQAYGGIAAESPPVAAAVRATAHQVVLYGGTVATTYFSSSSGGRTASALEVLGRDVPYLQSVPDPYDTYSPYHTWGPTLVDAATAARALKVPGQLVSLTPAVGPSGHVTSVQAVGTNGTVRVTGAAVRVALGLRSAWFSVGWLSLTPPPQPVAYGGVATLHGVARGVGAVTLETQEQGGTWQTVGPVTPAADGTFVVAVRPAVSSSYRLAAGQVQGALVQVGVTPLVSATLSAGAVQGLVRPALPGAPVQVQRQDGLRWTTVATGTTDTSGAFSVAAQLAPGAYRVRCVAGHGLSPGVSPSITQT